MIFLLNSSVKIFIKILSFTFKNSVRLVIIGSVIYIYFEYRNKISLNLKNPFRKRKKLSIIEDIINDLNLSNNNDIIETVVNNIPENTKLLKKIFYKIPIEIKVTNKKIPIKILKTPIKILRKKYFETNDPDIDQKLINSILKELEKLDKM